MTSSVYGSPILRGSRPDDFSSAVAVNRALSEAEGDLTRMERSLLDQGKRPPICIDRQFTQFMQTKKMAILNRLSEIGRTYADAAIIRREAKKSIEEFRFSAQAFLDQCKKQELKRTELNKSFDRIDGRIDACAREDLPPTNTTKQVLAGLGAGAALGYLIYSSFELNRPIEPFSKLPSKLPTETAAQFEAKKASALTKDVAQIEQRLRKTVTITEGIAERSLLTRGVGTLIGGALLLLYSDPVQ